MQEKFKQHGFLSVIIIAWALVLIVSFSSSRGEDVGGLRTFIGNLIKSSLFSFDNLSECLLGILISYLILAAWYGLGSLVTLLIKRFSNSQNGDNSQILNAVQSCALGAALWSLLWFFIGLLGAYNSVSSIVSLLSGLALFTSFAIRSWQTSNVTKENDKVDIFGKVAFIIILFILALTLISAVAPPSAKDALLYHFSVPRNFIITSDNSVIKGNIASYLALGTEMHIVWAMLLGNILSFRTGEAAASVTIFAFFPLLLLAIYGWARELNISKSWSLIAALLVASIPTAYHVASSGYTDLALALYITLTIRSIGIWWENSDPKQLFYVALYSGAALAIKLTTLFVIISVGLVILLRARAAQKDETKNSHTAITLLSKGTLALVCAGFIAGPWYVRNWIATGSPVFPFYLNVWRGAAPGWDVERSVLFQIINSTYGGFSRNAIDYLITPFTISLRAQPEIPEYFDGVLGAAFLFGLPLMIWAYRRFSFSSGLKIALFISGCLFTFWLFTSQQLRYLLPIFPSLAIAICYSYHLISEGNKALKQILTITLIIISVVSGSVTLAWFAQKNPLRVVLGGESREEFLIRELDYYPYYQIINKELPANSKIWLINMRRDSYHIEKPYFSDYMFEDYTFKQLVEESKSVLELQTKIKQMGITHILVRHDFLLNYKQSVLVDDKRSEKENLEKLKIAKELLIENQNVIRSDNRFSLIKLL